MVSVTASSGSAQPATSNGQGPHGGESQLSPKMKTNGDSNGYLAKPSGECCLKGTLHKGTPRGEWLTIAGIETYMSKPRAEVANGHVLIYFPDVWGMFNNGLLVMDAFADAGYLVLGLDYFRGDPVWKHRKDRHDNSNPNFDYEAWKRKHMAFASEATPRWVEEVVRDHKPSSATKFVCVGYCFGAPFVCKELSGPHVVAGAFAHPAFLKEEHFYDLQKPLFLSCSDVDHTFPTEQRQRALSILQEGSKPYQLQLFSGVEHGFALRGNPDDPVERHVKEESLAGIVRWLDFWVSQP